MKQRLKRIENINETKSQFFKKLNMTNIYPYSTREKENSKLEMKNEEFPLWLSSNEPS